MLKVGVRPQGVRRWEGGEEKKGGYRQNEMESRVGKDMTGRSITDGRLDGKRHSWLLPDSVGSRAEGALLSCVQVGVVNRHLLQRVQSMELQGCR